MENKITEMFENLPLWAKILLLVVAGTLISPIYRILRYLETKNTITLIVGILCLVTVWGNAILAIIDIITEVTKGRITVLAD